MHKKFNKNFLSAFLVQGFGAALIVLADMVTARLIGIHEYGLFSAIIAIVTILTVLGTAGCNQALLRYIPTYLAVKKYQELKGIISFSKQWSLLISSMLTLAAMFLFNIFDSKYKEAYSILLVALLAVPFNAQSGIFQSVTRAFNKVGLSLLSEYIFRPALFTLVIIVLKYSLRKFGADVAVDLYLAVSALIFFVGWCFQRSVLKRLDKTFPVYKTREWVETSGVLLLIVSFGLLSSRFALVILGAVSDSRNVAVYSASSRIADAVVFSLVVVNSAGAHLISSLYSQKKISELQLVIDNMQRKVALISLPVALITIVFGKLLLGFFGPGFSDGYECLVILVVGQLVNTLVGPMGYLMTMSGNHSQAAKNLIFTTGLNLIMCFYLIPAMGAKGAAVAVSLSNVVVNLLMLRSVKERLGIHPSLVRAFWREKT